MYVYKSSINVGETEEGWNYFYIISYISIKNSPIPLTIHNFIDYVNVR
jgi:hypothetical protein